MLSDTPGQGEHPGRFTKVGEPPAGGNPEARWTMDRNQTPEAPVGNFNMGECFCEVTCIHGHETRLFNIGRAHFVAYDTCRTYIWVGARQCRHGLLPFHIEKK